MFTRWRLPPESSRHLVAGAVAQAGQLEHPRRPSPAGSGTRSSRANSSRFSATVSLP